MKKTAKHNPTTFAGLVAIVARELRNGCHLRVVRPEGVSAQLKELRLRGVDARSGAPGVRVLCDGWFWGQYAPHEVLMTRAQQADLGICELKMGVGAFAYDYGVVCKAVSFRILPEALSPEMAEQLATLVSNPELVAQTKALADLADTKPYKTAVRALERAEKAAAAASTEVARRKQEVAKLQEDALKATRAPAKKTLRTQPSKTAATKTVKAPASRRKTV
ncbi:hypothetical protein D3C71_21950 [compost metagenome]